MKLLLSNIKSSIITNFLKMVLINLLELILNGSVACGDNYALSSVIFL